MPLWSFGKSKPSLKVRAEAAEPANLKERFISIKYRKRKEKISLKRKQHDLKSHVAGSLRKKRLAMENVPLEKEPARKKPRTRMKSILFNLKRIQK